MSTRSNIIIVTPDNQAHQFYHHCDGYLSGVGEELRGYLNNSTAILPDDYEDEGEHDPNDQNELHWDIEFLYIIKNSKLYYMEIWKSKDYKKLKTYKELVDYICINKHEIDLTKKVTDDGYIYEDNTPEDYETTKTEVKTMNYAEEKTRIENKIKELQNELETLEKTAKKEEWKNSLVEKFKEFLERTDFAKVDIMEFNAKKSGSSIPVACEAWFYNEKPKEGLVSIREFEGKPIKAENPEKVETEPTAKPTKEPERPENKIVICSVPKPNETPEEKPVKMKMTLDEFIDSLPEPAGK